MKLLLVEDEVVIAADLTQELEGAGHTVIGPAETVEEALRLADLERFDLALLNINLKAGGDGTELARVLLSRYGTPVLYVSGNMAQAHAGRDSAIGYVAKPYEAATVRRAVAFAEDLIEGRPAREPPPSLEVYPEPERKLG